ncbi:hypothetical protein [Rhodothermus profundi]|uniref:Uncharacterized protein n=1 Tax=Rhodothermus profundi TaxID=633813 RepID=A0A1M6RHR4_9BACT|nr:hypothetical protein [Rhodothermus profundi]SHK31918.1 hypothetical protein SAMN04488087_0850 [Rhodothermus profundi]
MRWGRLILGLVMLAFVLLAVADALDLFGRRPYYEVPHGNHTHYVPRDRDPDVPIERFPTRPPERCERIAPDGRLVPIEDCP